MGDERTAKIARIYEQAQGVQERLTAFLYLLMRDKLPVGVVNDLLKQSVLDCDGEPIETGGHRFSDDLLADKARSLAIQLMNGDYMVRELDARMIDPSRPNYAFRIDHNPGTGNDGVTVFRDHEEVEGGQG